MAYYLKSGMVENGVWLQREDMSIYDGGIANNTTIGFLSSMFVFDGGVAQSTTVGGSSVGYSDCYVYAGGSLNGAKVKLNGSLFVDGGAATNITIGHDYEYINGEIPADSVMTVKSGNIAGVKVEEHGILSVDGGNGENITVNEGGVVSWKSGQIDDLVVNGGTATCGAAVSISNAVVKEGSLTFNGEARDTVVKKGSTLTISGGVHYGSLHIEDLGAKVNVISGEINFSVVGRTTKDDYLINALSLIEGSPIYSITIDEDQKQGTYKLGKRGINISDQAAFNVYVVINGIETSLGKVGITHSPSASKAFYDRDRNKLYSLYLNDDYELMLRISGGKDGTAPEKPVAKANITGYTTKNVTVSATFDKDSKIKQYSINKGSWKTYKSGVVMKNNGMVYFRAADKAGNWSSVTSYCVNNIDRKAPVISEISGSTKNYSLSLAVTLKNDDTEITKCEVTYGNKKIIVTTFNKLMCSTRIDNLAIGKNTISVVAYDAAGNKSKAKKFTFTVKDVTAPDKVATLNAPQITNKYKGTFSWSAAKDNSGKIAKYQVQLDNGKIYSTSKTSLTVSNLNAGKHTYRVRAIDKSKNTGAWSALKTFTVKDMTAPNKVSVSMKVSGNKVTASWKKPKDNVGVTKYVLKYGKQTVTLSGSATKHVITGLNKGTYSYSMVAYDKAGNASKAETGKFTIKQALVPEAASAALCEASFASEFEASFAPEADILAYSSDLKSPANLSDISTTLTGESNEMRALLALQ